MTIAAVLALVGCRGGGIGPTEAEPVASETDGGLLEPSTPGVVRLGERPPSDVVTPLVLGPSQLDLATDTVDRDDAVASVDAEGRPCWLYSTAHPVALEVTGGEVPRPTVKRGWGALPEGEGAGSRYFVFDRPHEQLVVSTARDRKEAGTAGSWDGQAAAEFLLPAGPTRLVLSAPVTPEQAPPLELEVWVDGERLVEVYLELGEMVDTTVDLAGGVHLVELRCPRLGRVEWAHLVSPIELVLDVEPSHGRVRVYGFEGRPPRSLAISYPILPGGVESLQAWADGLEPASEEPLHRRLERGCCVSDVVLAPTPTEVTYEFDVLPGARLLVDLGQDRSVHGAGAAVGEILVDAGEGPQVLWTGEAATGDGCERGGEVLSLEPYEGTRISLTLASRAGAGEPAAAFWVGPTVIAPPREGADPRPNIVLVSLDTLRADHLGCYGYDRPTSPALDGLAAAATLYRRAYSTYPTTMLSHMALLRGTHPDSLSRSLAGEAGGDPAAYPADAVSMVQQRLRTEGWITAAFTGGGSVDKHWGFGEGFDAYCDCRETDDAATLARRADRWIEAHAGTPFFLFLHTYEVHGPYDPPPGYTAQAGGQPGLAGIDPYEILGRPADSCAALDDATRQQMVDLYDGEIRYTDEALIQPLLATLDRLGLAADTLLVVTSDHGEEFGEHGCWLHGEHLYDETVHVPLVVRHPGGAHRGEVVDGPVSLVDVAPTVLALLGLEYGDMEGKPLPRSDDDHRGDHAVARGMRFDVVGHESRSLVTSKTFVAGAQYKLILSDDTKTGDRAELFDLHADPLERRDRLVGEALPDGDPARAEHDRLNEISDPHLGRTLLEIEGAGAASLPDDLAEQLRALGYVQ